MNCYDSGNAGAISGGVGCLALTGSGPMDYFGLILLGISAVLLGVMLVQLTRRGTRIPGLRRLFPSKRGTTPPISPRS